MNDLVGEGRKLAVWQFHCYIISLKKISDKLCHDKMISWKDIENPLINPDFLERQKSWSTDIVQYGNIDRTCIEFIYDKDKLEEISCRLDLRTLTRHDLIQIVEYVQSIGACFLVNDRVYLPELEIMVPLIKRSNANLYCKSPPEYFKSIDQGE